MVLRTLAAAVISGAIAVPLVAQSHVVFRDPSAEALFKASRNAAGGEGVVSGVQSLRMRGSARVGESDGGPEVREVEIRIMLPDHMLRIDSADGFEKRAGLMGNDLLTAISAGGTRETPPAAMRAPLVRAERARLGRMMLGMAMTPLRPGWLTVRSVRTAVTTVDPRSTLATDGGAAAALTAERGGQRILEAQADQGVFVRMFFDGATRPSRIQYEAGKGAQVLVEFADRRRVSGLLLPHHIVTTAGGKVVDDLTLRTIEVNPKLTAADFEGR